MGHEVAGDGHSSDLAAIQTRTSVTLIFRGFHHNGRNFDDLEACRLRIIWARFGGQWGATILTAAWHEWDKVVDALGGQHFFEMRPMPGLPSAFAFGFFLEDRLGRARRIGRGRQRRVGTVRAQPRFQHGEALFQLGNAGLAFPTAGANHGVHAGMLSKPILSSCASFSDVGDFGLNGYKATCMTSWPSWLNDRDGLASSTFHNNARSFVDGRYGPAIRRQIGRSRGNRT
jgi:hypothetical protein